MESKTFKIDLEFSSIGTPSESLKEYYAKLYKRNQTKFIRRPRKASCSGHLKHG